MTFKKLKIFFNVARKKESKNKRARLLVHYNAVSAQFTHFESLSPLSTEQMQAALAKIVVQIQKLNSKDKQQKLEKFFEEQNKDAALSKKLLGKVSAWKKQSQIAVPKESFEGKSNSSIFSCQISGELSLQKIEIKLEKINTERKAPKNLHLALNQAIQNAEKAAFSRWKDALKGKLEEELLLKEKILEDEKQLLLEANKKINAHTTKTS